jgi:hypothetical protein
MLKPPKISCFSGVSTVLCRYVFDRLLSRCKRLLFLATPFTRLRFRVVFGWVCLSPGRILIHILPATTDADRMHCGK